MSQATMHKQERAKKAFEFVNAIKGNNLKHNEYKQYIKKLPMMIKTNGLSASLAFVFSKENKAYKKIYEQIGIWLQEKKIVKHNTDENLMKDIISLDSVHYRLATNETLALLEWMKRFADGMIKENEDKKSSETEKKSE